MTNQIVSHPNTKHGHTSPRRTKTPEYEAWCQMKRRCLGKTYIQYHDYGGRGISVHEPWLTDFLSFLECVGPKPQPYRLYSLDRIDNNGNYEPGNVRWATKEEQCNNKRPRGPEKAVTLLQNKCKNCGKEFMKNPNRAPLYCSKKCGKNVRERARYHRNKGKES